MMVSDESAERRQRVAVFGHFESACTLAVILSQVTGMHPLDAAVAARTTPAVLPTRFTSREAANLVARLKASGVEAAVIQDAELPAMTNVPIVHHARIGEDDLELCELHGDCAQRIPWNHILVVAVGRIPGRRHQRTTDEGRPSVLSAAPLPSVGRIQTPDHTDLELWLLCREPKPVYCIRHGEFNYETLGDARVSSAAVNFDRFLRQLIERASSARQTPGTCAFLNHHSLGCEFKSTEEIQQQALLAWVQRYGPPAPVT